MDSVTALVSGIPAEIPWPLVALPVTTLTIIVGKAVHLWRAQNQIIAAMDRAAAPSEDPSAVG